MALLNEVQRELLRQSFVLGKTLMAEKDVFYLLVIDVSFEVARASIYKTLKGLRARRDSYRALADKLKEEMDISSMAEKYKVDIQSVRDVYSLLT